MGDVMSVNNLAYRLRLVEAVRWNIRQWSPPQSSARLKGYKSDALSLLDDLTAALKAGEGAEL